MTKQKMGEAYAFFNCTAPRGQIERELPQIRQAVQAPNTLEISLSEVRELNREATDPKLLEVIGREEISSTYPSRLRHLMATAKPTRIQDLKYALHAKQTGATNEEVAEALVPVMNGIYLNYEAEKVFTGCIVGKSPEGEYGIWRED